jgi:hypothetical protein
MSSKEGHDEELELTEFQKKVEVVILTTPPRGKHSARNAIRHIKKAWELREIDREIAVFRAITGEEEAATAIFHSLKRHKYAGAEQLNPYNHVHKAAVYPFFMAVGAMLSILNRENLNPQVVLNTDVEHPKIKLRLLTPDKLHYIYPQPPLHYSIKRDGEIYDFSDELKMISGSDQVKAIDKQIKMLANERNELLYAHQGGILTFTQPVDEIIKDQMRKIFVFLTVYLLIDQYPEHQWFVQQTLNAFLVILGKLPADFKFE